MRRPCLQKGSPTSGRCAVIAHGINHGTFILHSPVGALPIEAGWNDAALAAAFSPLAIPLAADVVDP